RCDALSKGEHLVGVPAQGRGQSPRDEVGAHRRYAGRDLDTGVANDADVLEDRIDQVAVYRWRHWNRNQRIESSILISGKAHGQVVVEHVGVEAAFELLRALRSEVGITECVERRRRDEPGVVPGL